MTTSLPILPYVGSTTERVPLLAILREQHAAQAAAIEKQIAARKASGTPLDDKTEWGAAESIAGAIVKHIEARETDAAVAAAEDLVARARGNALSPLPPFEAPDGIGDDVFVVLKIPSADDRMRWQGRILQHIVERQAASKRQPIPDHIAIAEASVAFGRVIADRVRACVVRVEIGDDVVTFDEDADQKIEALRISGLFDALSIAVDYFLDLPAPKAMRCGQPALLT